MSHSAVDFRGTSVPAFLYGTAWKEQETRRLTALALEEGFRAIDTANQRRHYFEAAGLTAKHIVATALQALGVNSSFRASSPSRRVKITGCRTITAQTSRLR